MIREITTLEDAFDFMEEWPESRRGTIYHTALRALRAAHDKHLPMHAARNALEGFARSARILETGPVVPAWMTGKMPDRDGAPR
ncbi:MAG: DUF982 domain-containing protein [Rhizobiaceae bacterium]|nr:DUF982 domain-containing protein [Rhizobiaceae bacterium]MCV0408970.1 DUF982 domain-containing protein [Rhizobiaceae bacterium]